MQIEFENSIRRLSFLCRWAYLPSTGHQNSLNESLGFIQESSSMILFLLTVQRSFPSKHSSDLTLLNSPILFLYEETAYFLPLNSQKFLVLLWSTSEGWKAESILKPPSGFEHTGSLDWESSTLTTYPMIWIW